LVIISSSELFSSWRALLSTHTTYFF